MGCVHAWSYHQLRVRRALTLSKDVLLRTERALLLYKLNDDITFLVLNGTALTALKTLFNIVEVPFNFFLKLWCLCCMMMFRWTIKQPGIQKFWHLCGLYQDIYHWISPLIWLTINSNTAVYGEKWVWFFWSFAYFRFFEALNGAFEVQFFQGFILTPCQRHW